MYINYTLGRQTFVMTIEIYELSPINHDYNLYCIVA